MANGAPARLDSPLVELDQVSHHFPVPRGVLPVLDRVSLAVRPGEFVAVLGPSGCGKSTLLMVMAGLLRPAAGQVRVDGSPPTGPHRDIGMVFQDPLLLEWRTALDNILLQAEFRRLPRAAMAERAQQLLGQMGLGDFAAAYPAQLSRGMQQRVSLCRALLHQPRLLLLDEPFAALDALTREQMTRDLERLWLETRCTVVLVTHDISEAVRLADRVLVLTPRPARVARDLAVPVPRPRHGRAPEMLAPAEAAVRSTLEQLGVLRR